MELKVEPFGEEQKKEISNYVKGSLELNVLAIDPFEIEKLYPNAYKACKDYMDGKAETEVGDEIVVSVYLYSPRTVLYDFLDEKEVFINIRGQKDEWSYSVNNLNSILINKTRTLAEVDALKCAFEELEKKLTNK